MESYSMMYFFLIWWAIDLFVAVATAQRGVGPLPLFILPRIPLGLVALSMVSIFVIGGGATVAQFAAGSEGAMSLWSEWCQIWPMCLLLTAVVAVLYFIVCVVCLCRRTWRTAFWPSFSGFIASATGFFAVGCNFPDA